MPDPNFSVALLVGGQGRRLGGLDKSALIVDGRSILDRQIAEARTVSSHVFAVASAADAPAGAALPCVVDSVGGAGALGALCTALEHAPDAVVTVVACDMPFVTGRFLQWLVSQLDGTDAVIPCDAGGWHPLCAAYDRRAAERLGETLRSGVRRVQDALALLTVRTVGPEEYAAFDPEGRLLLNVNTPEDYHAALDRHP